MGMASSTVTSGELQQQSSNGQRSLQPLNLSKRPLTVAGAPSKNTTSESEAAGLADAAGQQDIIPTKAWRAQEIILSFTSSLYGSTLFFLPPPLELNWSFFKPTYYLLSNPEWALLGFFFFMSDKKTPKASKGAINHPCDSFSFDENYCQPKWLLKKRWWKTTLRSACVLTIDWLCSI